MKSVVACIITITHVILLSACGAKITKENKVDSFPVTSPVILDTTYNSDYVAEIHSRQNIEVRARVKGYLERIYVDEGARVSEGALLFSISSQEYREELLQAQAMLKSAIADEKAAELDVQNVKTLADKNIVSKTELAMARSKLEAMSAKTEEMRAHVASARLRLAYTEIRAPFDGVLDRLPNKEGSLVDEGELLTTLSDNREVYAYFNVSEKEYLAYTAIKEKPEDRDKVTLLLADNSFHPEMGKIETIEGEFDKGTGSIAFRARFPNPRNVLRHGASGKVRLKRRVSRGLVIPQKATFEIQDKMYVYVLDGTNTARMRSIIPQLRLPHLYIIAAGLSPDDRIIYEGIQEVTDGMKIRPKRIDMQEIIPQLARR